MNVTGWAKTLILPAQQFMKYVHPTIVAQVRMITCSQELVNVYTQFLEFYVAATRFFSDGSVVLRLVSEALNDRLPSIIEEFLFCSGLLHQSIENAAKLTADISRLLLDSKSMIHLDIPLPLPHPAGYRVDDLGTVKKLLGFDEEAKRGGTQSGIRKERAGGACSWVTQDLKFRRSYTTPGPAFFSAGWCSGLWQNRHYCLRDRPSDRPER